MYIKLSSAKKYHGLKELLSKDIDNFWHTEGNLPHFIEISFPKKTFVSAIELTLMYSLDDSYTPYNIEIRAGMIKSDMSVVLNTLLVEPEGPTSLEINRECFFIQVVVVLNHQEGRDTHIRGLRMFDEFREQIFINEDMICL